MKTNNTNLYHQKVMKELQIEYISSILNHFYFLIIRTLFGEGYDNRIESISFCDFQKSSIRAYCQYQRF